MSKKPIQRQHESTSIPELRGRRCSDFYAVKEDATGFVGPLYIKIAGEWHRFYLDAGLLFWQNDIEPEPDDELLDGEIFADFGKALNANGAAVESVEMDACQLSITFGNQARLLLKHGVQDQGTSILELVAGTPGE